jgi:hypothetical protein
MQTNLYTITIPGMIKTLEALSSILDKASAHAATRASDYFPQAMREDALLNDRIVFDQFELKRQVQLVSDTAKGFAARIAGVEVPKFEDTEKTIPELKARIEKTVAFLKTIKPEQVIGKEDAHFTLPFHDNEYITGLDYAVTHAIPNFYFHVTTAYAIVRKNGVTIGKADYLRSEFHPAK